MTAVKGVATPESVNQARTAVYRFEALSQFNLINS
jgi:hypothetical protein